MKLSEAIKKGRALRPQIRGDFKKITRCGDQKCVGTCDIGAAIEAVTGKPPAHARTRIIDDQLLALDEECNTRTRLLEIAPMSKWPEDTQFSRYYLLRDAVVDLNDKAKWPTEKTVAWLESIGQ